MDRFAICDLQFAICDDNLAGSMRGSDGRRSAPGSGALTVGRVAGRTIVTQSVANSPLKLLTPRQNGSAAWAFASTYGGGLLAGDAIALDVRVGERCRLFLGTQSATKVYRSADGRVASQTVNVSLGDDSICVLAPHPVACFARSRFVQRQRIEMSATASLVLIDWLTSGRHAAGERWAFDLYDSRTDIVVYGRHVFRDAMRLSPDDGAIDGPHRSGGFDCLAYAVLLGTAIEDDATRILREVEESGVRADPHEPLLFSASPLGAGLLLRAAGTDAQTVGRWIAGRLEFVGQLLDDARWSRMVT